MTELGVRGNFGRRTLMGPTDGHYLNLPVMNEGGEIVGMVDVLKLTYATLEQVNKSVVIQDLGFRTDV